MEMISLPAGPFTLGEGPDAHTVVLEACQIGRTPVTNGQYRAFVQATGHAPPAHWRKGVGLELLDDHPVVNVTWHDALAYCRWLSAEKGERYTLPGEAHWERAARGEEGRTYPWGDVFDETRCNGSEARVGHTTPVAAYPQGASPYGVLDLAGNVWEWCSSLDAPYPYDPGDGREALQAPGWRVLRGGSWYDSEWGLRAARRLGSDPQRASHNTGFRIARPAGP